MFYLHLLIRLISSKNYWRVATKKKKKNNSHFHFQSFKRGNLDPNEKKKSQFSKILKKQILTKILILEDLW